MTTKTRCRWAESDPLLRDYHDAEWGVPLRDSRALWEMLVLEGFQAGLAWITVLKKRPAFTKAFKGFDPKKVARFGEADVERLLKDEGIIRSRAKIEAAIGAAKIYLQMEKDGEDFATWLWALGGGKPVRGTGAAESELSRAVSKALKKKGFKFVGPVIIQAWLQAVGVIDDHAAGCFRAKRRR